MAGFVDSLVIAIGLDTKGVAQGVQEVGRAIDSGLKGAFDNAVKGASPLGEALKNLRKDAEDLKQPVDESLKALNELGIRSTEQIQQKIAELQASLEKINASTTLTARDKQAAIDEVTKRIERLKTELEKGIPQAAAEGFAGAEAAANKFKGAISSIWEQISGPLMGAFAIGNTISSYISNATAAGELADKLKVDIEEIQIWSGAMDRAGGSASALQGTIEKLTKSGKDGGDVFGVLLDLADKAETMSKEAFVAKAKELEIDEKTIEVLQQGRKALDEHLRRQKELGAYRKEDAENAKKFKQSLADLLQAWDSFTSFIGRLAVPAMKWLADVLTDVVVFLRQHTPFVVAAISLVAAALASRLMPPLRELPKLIAGVSKAFLRWFPFIAIITALALLIEDFYAYLVGGNSQFAEFWSIFGEGPEIMQKLQGAWKDFKQWSADVFNGLVGQVRLLWQILSDWGVIDGIKNAFLGLGHVIHGFFTDNWKEAVDGAKQMFGGLWDTLAGPVQAFGRMVSQTFSEMWTALKEGTLGVLSQLGSAIWNWFVGLVGQIRDFALEKISSILEGIKLPSLSDILGGAGDAAKTAGDALGGAAKGALSLGEQAAGALKAGLSKAGDLLGGIFSDAGPKTEEAGAKVEAGMAQTAGAVKQGFDGAWRATAGFAVQTFQGAASTIQQIFAGIVSGIETQVGNLVLGAQRMAGQAGMVPAFAGVRAQHSGGGGNVTYNQQNRTNIYANGGDPQKVQAAAQRGQDASNRRLTQAKQSGTVPKG